MIFAKSMTVAPAIEAISLATARLQLRITSSTSEDALILDYITAARENVEMMLGQRLVTQTWEFYLGSFPDVIRLDDISPLQSVTSITYTDTDGATQTLATSEYTVDAKRVPGEIHPAWGKTWPSTRSVPNAVTVTAVVGYATLAKIPKIITQYMLLLIAEMDLFRQPIITGTIVAKIPHTVISAVEAHNVRRFA